MTDDSGYSFAGMMLVATVQLRASLFEKAVILVCHHNEKGTMGLVVNQPLAKDAAKRLFPELSLKHTIYFGGPVDISKGFLLHSGEKTYEESSLSVTDKLWLSSTAGILEDIHEGEGPEHVFIALGLAGWEPGQLEQEIKDNSWLTLPANHEIIFEHHHGDKWLLTYQKLGVDPYLVAL